ncbi:MAG: hypothetical protein R6X25_14955 [Candidatus Krumholzibacteriia bacterium]
MMKSSAKAIGAVAVLVCLIPAAAFALQPYSQDFEGLVQTDTGALANDGWLVFANVFGPDWSYWYGYGPFPAPNDGPAFSQIVTGEGGAAQGTQQLVVISDYNNADHGNGAFIESNVFQEQTVTAGDVGQTWFFGFDAKIGNLEGSTTALAFIKTLDPGSSYAMTNFITVDMTAIPATWSDFGLSIVIDPGLVGQILQFGFANTATNYAGSAVFYDNVIFNNLAVGADHKSWSEVRSLFR